MMSPRKKPATDADIEKTHEVVHIKIEEEYDPEEENPNGNDPVGKRKKYLTHFTDEQEQSMVEWLRDYPVLYNKKMRDYKATGMKERLWEAKAADIGKSKLELQTWYKSIRTRYGRLKKKKPGNLELTERDEWILTQLEFLRPFVVEKPMKALVSMKGKTTSQIVTATAADSATASPVGSLVHSESDVSALPNTYSRSTCDESTASANSGQKVSEEDVYGGRMQIIDLQKQLLERLNKPQVLQERDSFCDYLRSVMYGFSPAIWRRCQAEMLQVLLKYQELNDPQMQQQHQN